jgi:hypothetical protein
MLNAWLIASLLLAGDAPAPAAPTPTQVMVLGTFHMANPGLDVINSSVKDILGERRQKEILEVVTLLEKFRPTKIALERVPDSPRLQKRLEKYLAGQYTLTADEEDQLGLRLAKNLNHRALYGIDFDEDLGLDAAFRYAEKHPQPAVQAILSEVQTQIKSSKSSEYMEKHSVRQILLDFNGPAMDDLVHRFYMALLRVGKGKDYPGTDAVSHWYDRNLRIATHIARLADGPGERILVIIGSGHGKLLRQFIAEMPGFELVDCSTYLK